MAFRGFEQWDRMRFRTNVLKKVICQVRFSHTFAIEEPSSMTEVQKALKSSYPEALPREQVLFELSVQGAPAGDLRGAFIYRFRDPSGAWVVSLSPDWVGLDTSEYTDFEEFRERLDTVVQLVEDEFGPAQRDRIGFRYINELPCGGKRDWRQLIRPELFGLAADDKVLERLIDCTEELHLLLGEHKLNVRHGVAPSNDAYCYGFDIDAFSEGRGEFKTEEIMPIVEELKTQAWSFFRASVTDELLAQLGTEGETR